MISERKGFVRSTAPGTFADYKAILEAIYELAGRGACLDLGTGESHVTKNFDRDSLLVDLVVRPNPHLPVLEMDIRDVPLKFSHRRFNLMLMSDVIEHLHDADARRLITGASAICGAIAIFTPVGPFKLNPEATDPDSHKSAWTPEQFWAEGWEVWEWPCFHHFEGGRILGAFWAWKFIQGVTPPVEAVAQMAGVDLTE